MKTHHFYYLSAALAICTSALLIYVFVSEALFFKDEFSKEEDKIVAKADPPKKLLHTVQPKDTTSFVKGIDVSKYQKEIDWTNLPESIRFVFCRATEGRTLVDSEFHQNWSSITANGRIRGTYHFYRSNDDPVVQARFFWNVVGSVYAEDLPLVLDIEAGSLVGTVDQDALTTDLLTFLKEIEQLSGKKPMVYSNVAFANEYLKDKRFAAYPLWMAEYTQRTTPNVPNLWKDSGSGWQFWQRSATYDLEATNGDVDFDVFNGNEESLKAFARSTSEENS